MNDNNRTLKLNYDDIDCLRDELSEIRHRIHCNPELGNKEYETSKLIKEILAKLDVEIDENKELPETAVVGILRCKNSQNAKTIAFRADIDALSISEKTGLPWSSKKTGIMHACGHDFHTTALLGAAELLSKNRESLNNNIMFIFQPDEEGSGGAERIVNTGIFEKNKVFAVFGAHVDPDLEAGKIGLKKGGFYATSDIIDITIKGKSCHGAEPEKGIDALKAGAEMVIKLSELSCAVDEMGHKRVVSIGSFNSGTTNNIISEKSEIKGISRTFGSESRKRLKMQIKNVVLEVARTYGVEVELDLKESYPGIFNDAQFIDEVYDIMKKYYVDNIVMTGERMTTEDFGYYLMRAKGCFFHFGVGGDYPLHNPRFYPNDYLISQLSEIYYKLALSY